MTIFAVFGAVRFLFSADVYIKIVQTGKKVSIGIAGQKDEFAAKVTDVVRQDLLFSRYFDIKQLIYRPVNEKSGIEQWKNQGVEAVVFSNVITSKAGFVLEGKIFDMQTGETVLQKNFKGTEENFRKPAHEFADEIIKRFTGQKGVSHGRIAFVNDKTGHKEIYTADYDGSNVRRLTGGNSIAITPRWSPDASKIAFTSWKLNNPDLYVINADGTGERRISDRQGLNTSPSWSADGTKMVLTLSMGKSPNLYMIDLNGEILKQITRGRNINTSACYSKSAPQIAFISDRAGNPQIYLTDIDGANMRRIYTDGYSDSPRWSPHGDAIVYSMQTSGQAFFDIYLYDIMNSKQFQLTSNSGSNESPSFSPDGRFVVFSTSRNGRKEIFTMFADGTGQMRALNLPGNSEMPDWSN